MNRIIFLVGLSACKGPDPAPETLCDGSADASVVIGKGTGGLFEAFATDEAVGVQQAPQGGNGVSVQLETTGLVANAAVDVTLEVEVEGVTEGSFLSEAVQLFCTDDGKGTLWGLVVGFDDAKYPTQASLLAFDDTAVDLVVTVVDEEGDAATGRVTVLLDVVGDTGGQ